MLTHEVSPPRRRWLWPVTVVLAFAGIAGAAILLAPAQSNVSQVAPGAASPTAPASPPPPPEPQLPPSPPVSQQQLPPSAHDEPIAVVAAAGDAPVIALASAHHVWISRDDGTTFARALESSGSINSLVVEPDGRVYVRRSEWGDFFGPTDELGIADPDGRERWREPPRGALPVDARAGWIVGMAGGGGMVVGWDAGDRWDRIPATHEWNPWRMAMGKGRMSYYLATKIGGAEHGVHLLAASEAGRAKTIWSLPSADGVGTPDGVVPCAAFAGDTLHLVVRGQTPGSSRLVAVKPDGRTREQALVGQLLDDRDLTCTIAGNDRAAYMMLHTARTLHQLIRIDTDPVRDVASFSVGFDRIAVDAHGYFLFVQNGCLQRLSQAGRQRQLVCGPER
ncbi:MAG TPA: hypothetical protein VGD80_30945 [Kofleriaceae bacterium]